MRAPSAIVKKTEIPGPRSRRLLEEALQHTPRALSHATPVAIAHAEGALLTDVDGNTYIDFAGGIGVQNVGHRAPAVVAALKEQADRYLHQCFMVSLYEPYVELARRLNALTPGSFAKKTVLLNSGAEAVENAVKIARVATGRPGIVAFERSFHGRTLLALALTGQVQPYKAGFGPLPGEVHHLPYPYPYRGGALTPEAHFADLFRARARPQDIAAVIIEPILGEGGFVVPPPGYLAALQALCRAHGILLIADEIQSGFGRTGALFAVEHEGVAPDLLVMAKSLAGGEVLSAVTGRAELMDALDPGSLGGTYGGNPMACRAALAALDIMTRPGFLERARAVGERTRARFEELQRRFPLIGEVRGRGAMLALELVVDGDPQRPAGQQTAAVLRHAYEHGLILLKAGADGNVIRTLMPLTISDALLDEGLDVLEAALVAVGAG